MFKKLLVEFIGTFFIIFFGFVAIINTSQNQPLGTLFIALAFGITTLLVYYIFYPISRSHNNPAISFSFFIMGRLTLVEFLLYTLSQIVGGFVAMTILALIFSKNISLTILSTNYGVVVNSDLGAILIIMFVEFIASFFLMFVYSITKRKNFFLIGFAIFTLYLLFYNIDGMGLNPVRVLIPALFNLNFTNTIIYILAIFGGSLAGGLFNNWFYKKNKKKL